MSLTGNVTPKEILRGKINDIIYLDTYQIAVKNGYKGTVEEWLAILEGEKQSQGRSAKYSFTSPGWKRVLNIMRTSGGMVNFGIAQSFPLYMSQTAGICFSGFVKYKNDTTTDKKPVLYQMYNNLFGEDDAMQNPGRITAVRIGYPDPKQENYNNGTSDALTNPINCYLDVLVEFDKDKLKSKSVAFNMNYAGFADSHNCEAITEETEATDVGIYGEKLLYHTLELNEGAGLVQSIDNKTPDENGNVHVIDDSSIGTDAWSSKNILDTLCPTFSYSTLNTAIECEPLEGYPLNVIVEFLEETTVSDVKNLVLNQTGKNMFNMTIPKDKAGMRFSRNNDGGLFIIGTPTASNRFELGTITLPAGTYTFGIGRELSAVENQPEIYCRLIEPGATKATITWVGVENSSQKFTLGKTTTLNAEIIIHNNFRLINKIIYPQIEVGSVATKFETYRGKSYSIDFTNIPDNFDVFSYDFNKGLLEYFNPNTGSYEFIYLDPQPIIGMSGINCLYATGYIYTEIDVSGYSDPKKLFEKMTNAIISLGGNV